MGWLDWVIVVIPLLIVLTIGLKSQQYVKSVADFLAAGRVAGRYVICVAGGEAGMGLISLVAIWEKYYMVGFAINFWSTIAAPLGLIMGLTGYCTYRFRETRAMTMGQFFEMRYSRSFRIFAAVLQSLSGVINYAIFPAVGARCLMYFLDLPVHFYIGGWKFSTFGLLMLIFLSIAVWIVTMGGQITIMVTDCVQGLISYPFYAVIVAYIIYRFSWDGEIIPALMNRPPGKSMLNPYDVSKLSTFNLFYVFVGVFSSVFNRMAWSGSQGYNAAAKNAHEQKMGALLGTWRSGFSYTMYTLLAVAAFTYMTHLDFRKDANRVHQQLTQKTSEEIMAEKRFDAIRPDVMTMVKTGEVTPKMKMILRKSGKFDMNKPLEPSQYRDAAQAAVATVDRGKAGTLRTIYHQMLVPVAIREMLPMGITGVLCALMIFLMISTDTTYMHSWGSIIVQDIILPFRKTPFTPKQQLNLLRCIIAGVAVFAFLFSFFFVQMDYILMFFAITGAIWLGGAGPTIVLGLYWKRGTTAGAFAALGSGSFLAVAGIICQQTWAKYLYPALEKYDLVSSFSWFFESASRPFNPYIVWKVTPDRFPVNSQEIYFIAMLIAVSMYVIVSLITCRQPFNLERMLHRGIYADSETKPRIPWTFRSAFSKIIGIDQNYSKGDKVLAWSVFLWSFGYGFCLCFLGIIIWNAIYPWPAHWWAIKFHITALFIPCIVAVISTVWFSIGGTMDLHRLFKSLASKHDDFSDDGRVHHHRDDQENPAAK
ncbi:MAG: sodium:panthothenate symporter [Lentisphaeria bacterium]|nr:sodium:panthothenate symporter [Lentisphaeria bacterium]